MGDLLEFSTPMPTVTPKPPAMGGLGGFKIPSLDVNKVQEYNQANPETPNEAGIEWAESDADIKPEDAEIIDSSFNDLYHQNTDLQNMVSGAFESDLSLIQKYQILELFMDSTETPRGQHPAQEADPSEFVEHNGKMYRQVAIDG